MEEQAGSNQTQMTQNITIPDFTVTMIGRMAIQIEMLNAQIIEMKKQLEAN